MKWHCLVSLIRNGAVLRQQSRYDLFYIALAVYYWYLGARVMHQVLLAHVQTSLSVCDIVELDFDGIVLIIKRRDGR
jgi:hypothetical protein